MSLKTVIAAAVVVSCSGPIAAQEANISTEIDAPLSVSLAPETPQVFLPANTELSLSMNQEVSTKGQTWSEGDTFGLSVAQNVMIGDYVVIPKGSRALGRITFLTSKGAFGKSGKMDIEIEYVEVKGRRIPLDGTYRQEGEGNTVATIGGVVLAGVFAGFITGKSGRIPKGRELTAHTEEDIPLTLAVAKSKSAQEPVRSATTNAPSTEQSVRPPPVIRVGG